MENMPAELQTLHDPETSLFTDRARVSVRAGSPATVAGAVRPTTSSVAIARVGFLLVALLTAGFETFGADEETDTTSGFPLDRVIVTATRTSEVESQIGSAFSGRRNQDKYWHVQRCGTLSGLCPDI